MSYYDEGYDVGHGDAINGESNRIDSGLIYTLISTVLDTEEQTEWENGYKDGYEAGEQKT